MRFSTFRQRGGKAFVWMLVGLLLGGSAGAGAVYFLKAGKLPAIPGGPRLGAADELAMVPPDAVGFVHIRARDLWKSEHFADIRAIIEKAGPEAFAALDEGFVPAPTTFDRITVAFLKADARGPKGGPPKGGFDGPRPGGGLIPGLDLPFDAPTPEFGGAVVIVSFTAAYDAEKFRSSALPGAVQKSVNGKDVWADKSSDVGAYFQNDRVMVLGSSAGIEQFVAKLPKDGKYPKGPLTDALNIGAEGGRHFVAGVNLKALGANEAKLFENMSDDVKPIEKELRALAKADAVAIGLSLGKDEMKVDIRAAYESEEAATAAENAVKPIAEFARTKLEEPRKMMRDRLNGKPGQAKPRPIKDLPESLMYLAGLGALNKLDETLANPPVKREGMELVATFELPSIGAALAGTGAIGAGLALPAVQKVREAAGRMQGSNNLKQIGLAMHNYHDANGFLPAPGGKATPNGKDGLSWRVHILPYIEQDALYKEFKLDEPWDSPNNKKLIDRMPKVYQSPLALAPPGQTYYKVFVGRDTAFPPGGQSRIPASFQDGTSNTILAVEGGKPVIWTKPDDIPFTGEIDPKSLYLNGNPRINVLLVDGSVRPIDLSRMSPQTLERAINPHDGQVLGNDW